MVAVKGEKAQVDARFLQRAFDIREKSDDPKAVTTTNSGVGAVIVYNNTVVSESANVITPKYKASLGTEPLKLEESDRYHFIEHAERATIFSAVAEGKSVSGGTLYCTRFPCSDCARAISWFGIQRVVTGGGLSGEQRWLESQRAALKILRASGVKVRVLKAKVTSNQF
jgi:deoxycytidylate deaminase